MTIGVGGPRAILAGDVGTYSVALENLGNVDAPYTFFQVGVPEMGINTWVYNLPYAQFFTNVRGAPPAGLADVPWASLESIVNTDHHNTASGYLLHHAADAFTGFSFNLATYPGLRELHDRSFEELRERLYQLRPDWREAGVLDNGPEGLETLFPGMPEQFLGFATIPDPLTAAFIPYQTYVVAAATAMTREEFTAHALAQAETLRQAIIADDDAPPRC